MISNDSDLIRRTLSGDDDAFSLLMNKYKKQVHALAWRIVGDFHIAEEIMQDTFLIAYKDLKNLKEPQSFAGWLSVITRRRCFAWLRKKRVTIESYEYLEESGSEQIEETTYSKYVVEEKERTSADAQRYVVKKLLAKLQESERTVITLHYFGEMTCSEIGEFLGVSSNTIKSRLHRAQKRLKKQEPMIREALEHFKITPNLTENIMREIANTKPVMPSGGKPFVPWLVAASTFVLVIIMLGIGNNSNLALFQQPYSLDAISDIPVEIVEAPIVENRALESDVRRQVGNTNSKRQDIVSSQQPDDTSQQSVEVGEKKNVENYPQWHLPENAVARLGKGGLGTLHFSQDGKQLAVGSQVGLWKYDVQTGEEISLLPNLRGGVAFSPDGRYIANTGGDPLTSYGGSHLEKGVMLWNITTESEISVQDTLPPAYVMRFSNDSKALVFLSLSRDTIYRVDVETGKTTTTKMGERKRTLHLEKYALTEDRIAIGSDEGSIELWDTTTGQKISTLRKFGKEIRLPNSYPDKNQVLTMEFSPDGTRLATGNLDTTVQLWDTSTGEELIVLQKPIQGNIWGVKYEGGKEIINNPMKNDENGRPVDLAFSPDGLLLACGDEDSTIKLWNTFTGELIATFTGHFSSVGPLAFSPDGNILVSGGGEGSIRFWDISKRIPLHNRITGHMWMRKASIINHGSKLASVSSRGIITVWDLNNGIKTTSKTKTMLEEQLYWNVYRDFVFSPDGTMLAANGKQSDPSKPNYKEDVLRLTDVKTGRELKTLPWGYCEVFSPDGKTLVSGAGNRIRLLDIETGKEREIITSEIDENSDEHKPFIRSVAFSPDGERIISGTMGGYVQLWDVETGMELSSFFEEIPPKGHSYREPILNLAFSSDGALIAVDSLKRIRLIGRAKQQHFKELSIDHPEFCTTLIFSPDNSVLIVGYRGGKIRLWDVPTGKNLITLDGHSNWVQDLLFTQDNNTLISVGSGTILFWDWERIIANAREEEQIGPDKVNFTFEEQTKETVLQFHEHSPQKPKTSDYILTKGEIYMANEWYDLALEQFNKNLSAADYNKYKIVSTPPSFHRELFEKIGKIGKNVQDKEGYTDMVNKLIEIFPKSQSIQLNAHLVLAEFYHDNDMVEKASEHIQNIDLLTTSLPSESVSFQLNVYLSLAKYYQDTGILDKENEYLKMIEDMIAELDPNNTSSLKHRVETQFDLAEYYRDKDMNEKADEHIQNTGLVTEDTWMVLGPFDNEGGIGFNTPYIHEDITEIDINTIYNGIDNPVSWKNTTDTILNGNIHLGEKNVNWHVYYAYAKVTSPYEREVQFRFDSDDQGKVWLNGKEVFSHTKTYAVRLDKYKTTVTLQPGKNSILIKVCNEEGACNFILRITDQDGQAVDDLKIHRIDQH